MCGIVSVLGQNVSQYIKLGLKQLQNRGYDSIGFSIINKKQFPSTMLGTNPGTKRTHNIINLLGGPGTIVGGCCGLPESISRNFRIETKNRTKTSQHQ